MHVDQVSTLGLTKEESCSGPEDPIAGCWGERREAKEAAGAVEAGAGQERGGEVAPGGLCGQGSRIFFHKQWESLGDVIQGMP